MFASIFADAWSCATLARKLHCPGMIAGPTLQLINEAGEAVLTLTEDIAQADLMRSRLTRAETQNQLLVMAQLLCNAP